MKKLVLNCKIITPLFMGGATQEPELRTQSFNGLFRYWFRLLGGSFEDEKRLFGWGGEGAKRGLVAIAVKKDPRIRSTQFQRYYSGYDYLGFSLALTNRKGIKEDERFKLLLRFHPISNDDDIKKFLCAVWCAFCLGNFGSRSRRGFGSIMVEEIEGNIPQNFDLKFKPQQQNVENWLKKQLEYIQSLNYWCARQDIPYIFENLEIYRINNYTQGFIQLLNTIGLKYKNYRREYDLSERIWFGLPVRNIIPRIGGETLRRASPMIFKIIKFNNNFKGFILVFKPNDRHNFKFLPDGAEIISADVNLNQPNWQILDDFIKSLRAENLIIKVYP